MTDIRTDAEILARLSVIEERDWMGFQRADLICYLPLEAAKAFLRPHAKTEEWKPTPRDHDSVKSGLVEYMSFAWGKANNCRGISAARSLDHMSVWVWMLGEDEAADGLSNYTHYGKPQLRAICEHFGIDWGNLDDGQWREGERGHGVPPEVVPAITLKWRQP